MFLKFIGKYPLQQNKSFKNNIVTPTHTYVLCMNRIKSPKPSER